MYTDDARFQAEEKRTMQNLLYTSEQWAKKFRRTPTIKNCTVLRNTAAAEEASLEIEDDVIKHGLVV